MQEQAITLMKSVAVVVIGVLIANSIEKKYMSDTTSIKTV
jgi:hypothetical protein